MAEIVNLRMARKAHKRKEGEAQASANRAKHGQAKSERTLQEQQEARIERLLDGARREKD